MKTQKQDWPKTVTVGNASVKVYKRITESGNVGFMVAYRDENGKRKFESVSVETEAIKLAEKKAGALSTFGARVAGTSARDIAEFVRVSDMLKPFNVTVGAVIERVTGWLGKHSTLEAIGRALESGPAVSSTPRAVSVVVEEVLKLKESNGASSAYNASLKCLLGKFSRAFVCDVGTVSTANIQNWLDTQKLHAATYNNLRMTVHTFFAYCVRRGYVAQNPVAGVEVRKDKGTNAEVFTPSELQKLLMASKNGLQARLAISAFAGVRTAEFSRLTWDNVDFVGGNIVLDAGQAKTASRRIIPMQDNLRAWLEQSKGKGKIWKGTLGQLTWEQHNTAKRAGVVWKDNALRHSFCSYRLAVTKDAAKVAFEAGNSATMIHRHYKALVSEQSALEWFAIVPPTAAPGK